MNRSLRGLQAGDETHCERVTLVVGGFTADSRVPFTVLSPATGLSLLFLGPFTAPPVIVGTLVVLLLILVVGRVLLGLAWRLVLIALGVVVILWLVGALGSGLPGIG